jgi:hypothetical protein
MNLRMAAVGLLVFVSGCLALDARNRSVFASLTYGDPDAGEPPVPKAAHDFQLYAALQGDVMGPWNQPGSAAACLEALTVDDLHDIGEAVSTTENSEAWAAAVWNSTAGVRASAVCGAGFAADPQQLAWAVGKVAGTTYDFAQLSWLTEPRRRETYQAAVVALKAHAAVLRQTPTAQASRTAQPSLALSGGAANGAFSAGALYELLSAREEALDAFDAGDRQALADGSRFSSVVGTSVGGLLAQVVDFNDLEPFAFSPEQQRYLDLCNDSQPRSWGAGAPGPTPGCFSGFPDAGWPSVAPPKRPIQACALKLLERYFTDSDETDLICAEPGSVTRVAGFLGRPRVNFIRFDPLQREVLDPLFQHFSKPMQDNGLTRVVMAVETRQSQLLGLDERACPEAVAPECLSAGVVASFVLPLFARPVSHTWSGFTGAKGECGIWYDGGLRSTLPVARALALSRPTPLLPRGPALRVLSIDNGRLTPMPAGPAKIILDTAFNGLGQLTNEQGVAELATTQGDALQRDDELAALLKLSRPPVPDAGPLDAGSPPSPVPPPPSPVRPVRDAGVPFFDSAAVSTRDDGRTTGVAIEALRVPSAKNPRVRGVYVPAEVQDWVVVGTGYSFDPYVMRGLFLAGRLAVRRHMQDDLLTALGWDRALIAKVKDLLGARDRDPAWQAWVAAYDRPLCRDFAIWRRDTGQKRILSRMELCGEVPAVAQPDSGVPAYFSCPSGAWNAGAP